MVHLALSPRAVPQYFIYCINIFSMLDSQENVFQCNGKNAVTVPVFKKGNYSSATNYRHNSLLNNFPEVFKFVIHDHISPCFKQKSNPSQYVILKTKSTINLVTYFNFISPLLGAQLVRLVLFIVIALHSALFHIIFHSINDLFVDSAMVMKAGVALNLLTGILCRRFRYPLSAFRNSFWCFRRICSRPSAFYYFH